MTTVNSSDNIVTEMAIVDIFTGLIFDSGSVFNHDQQLVIDALKQIDNSLYEASRRDISEYIRSMDINEMIVIVAKVKIMIGRNSALVTLTAASKLAHSLRSKP